MTVAITFESRTYLDGYTAFVRGLPIPPTPRGQLTEGQASDLLEFRRGWVDAERDRDRREVAGIGILFA